MPVNTFFLACRWPPYKSIITVCYCSVSKSCPTLCDPMGWSMPGFLVLHLLPEFTQTHVHWVSDGPSKTFILCHPLLLLPSVFPSIRMFSNELALHIRWPKYWRFSFSISASHKYSELVSFRIDWFDLLAVQGTFKSLLKHHSSKASIFQCSASQGLSSKQTWESELIFLRH